MALLGARSRGRPGALEASLAGAAALSLVASPHLLPHDLVILAPAFAWCAARAACAESGSWPGLVSIRVIAAWAVLGVLTLVDTGNAAAAPPGRLVPLGLIGIGIAALMIPASPARAGNPRAGGARSVRRRQGRRRVDRVVVEAAAVLAAEAAGGHHALEDRNRRDVARRAVPLHAVPPNGEDGIET